MLLIIMYIIIKFSYISMQKHWTFLDSKCKLNKVMYWFEVKKLQFSDFVFFCCVSHNSECHLAKKLFEVFSVKHVV